MKIRNEKEIIELKQKLAESNIDTKNLMYVPDIPILGFERSYVIEEIHGIKVARLITVDDN